MLKDSACLGIVTLKLSFSLVFFCSWESNQFICVAEWWKVLNLKVKFLPHSLIFHNCRLCKYAWPYTLYWKMRIPNKKLSHLGNDHWTFVPFFFYTVDRVLKHNELNGSFNIGPSFSNQLQIINLQGNSITSFNNTGGHISFDIM